MWIPSDRPGLRDEKRSEKERMCGKFKHPGFAILIRACNLHPFLSQLVLGFRIQSEVAIELLHQSSGLVSFRVAASGNQDEMLRRF